MEYPVTELEYWASFFSIDDNKDKPRIKPTKYKGKASSDDIKESIKQMKAVLN